MNENAQKLSELCNEGMQRLGFVDEKIKIRLKKELQAIFDLEDENYFLDLCLKKLKFAKNENNLLVAYLIGLCNDFDANKEPEYIYGDFPDADIDYIPVVRDYLKDEWCPKQFGERNVRPIGNYGTFGIKSGLIDMARIFGKDRQEVLSVTKPIEDKDDEGKPITFDKAL